MAALGEQKVSKALLSSLLIKDMKHANRKSLLGTGKQH